MKRLFTLLIVEDDPLILQALAHSRHWPDLGYALIGAAATGEEAMAMALSHSPDVVLTDIRMNGMSGLDLIELLRTHCPETMYVILSGYSEFEYARRALQLGVFEYLTKPIDSQKFNAVFARLYERLTENRQRIDSIGAARNEFLMDVLSREMDPAYLQERLSTLQLGEEAQWYRVVLLEGEIVEQKILQEQFSVAAWQHIILGARYALIFSSIAGAAPEVQLQSYIHSHSGVRIGIGGQTKLAKLQQSRKEAERALDTLFFSGECIGAAKETPNFDHLGLNQWADNVVQAWASMDERTLRAAVADYFRFVRGLGSGRDIVLLNIIHILNRVFVQLGEGQQPPMGVDHFQKSLMNAFTLDQLEIHTSTVLSALHEKHRKSSLMAQESLPGRACAYIEAHIQERIALSDVAAHLYVNASYLSRIFKQAIGDTISHYITHKKIVRAMEDMRNLSLGIREIAIQLGFSDYSYFCVQFKKETGETPLNYRKRLLYGDAMEKK